MDEQRIEKEDWRQAIARAIEPKFRGLGRGDTPRAIAYEVAMAAFEAIEPLIEAVEARAWESGKHAGIEASAGACESRIRGTDGLPGGDEYGHQAPYNCEDLACALAIRTLLAVGVLSGRRAQ